MSEGCGADAGFTLILCFCSYNLIYFFLSLKLFTLLLTPVDVFASLAFCNQLKKKKKKKEKDWMVRYMPQI